MAKLRLKMNVRQPGGGAEEQTKASIVSVTYDEVLLILLYSPLTKLELESQDGWGDPSHHTSH
jgi:hypothetical protein